MHPQWESMNVTSKTHVRSSSGSSKLTHSWVPSRACRSATGQLHPELAGGEESLPELVHHHPFVGCVETVAGQADTEEQYGRLKDATQRFFRPAPAFTGEQGILTPHAGDGPAQGLEGGVVDRREGRGDAWALGPDRVLDPLGD